MCPYYRDQMDVDQQWVDGCLNEDGDKKKMENKGQIGGNLGAKVAGLGLSFKGCLSGGWGTDSGLLLGWYLWGPSWPATWLLKVEAATEESKYTCRVGMANGRTGGPGEHPPQSAAGFQNLDLGLRWEDSWSPCIDYCGQWGVDGSSQWCLLKRSAVSTSTHTSQVTVALHIATCNQGSYKRNVGNNWPRIWTPWVFFLLLIKERLQWKEKKKTN